MFSEHGRKQSHCKAKVSASTGVLPLTTKTLTNEAKLRGKGRSFRAPYKAGEQEELRAALNLDDGFEYFYTRGFHVEVCGGENVGHTTTAERVKYVKF